MTVGIFFLGKLLMLIGKQLLLDLNLL